MLHLFLPTKHVNTYTDITPEILKAEGKKGIIIDLDNTLVAWNEAQASDKVKNWLQLMSNHDIRVVIFSNNNEERVTFFAEPLNIPFVFYARKPLKRGFRKAVKMLGLDKSEVVVIGDQLLTDILGGNRAGIDTILVVPIVQSDAAITRFNRNMERMILNHFYRKGKLVRRDQQDE